MNGTLLFLSLCLPVFAFPQRRSSITSDLNDVSFIDDNNSWTVGCQGKIIHTTSGGTPASDNLFDQYTASFTGSGDSFVTGASSSVSSRAGKLIVPR